MMRLRRYSIELYNELGVFETVGSLRIAAGPESLKELQRGLSRARGIGLDAQLLGADEARRLMPAGLARSALRRGLDAGRRLPRSARRDLRAGRRGARPRRRDPHRRRASPASSSGPTGGCARCTPRPGRSSARSSSTPPASGRRRSSAMVGAFTPVDPRRPPAHRAEGGARATSCRATCRASATPTTSSTARPSRGGVLFGGYEPNAPSRWEDGVPWEHGGRALPADKERFAPLMAGAVRRFPFLADAGVAGLVCHPDAMTPDAQPAARADARRARLLDGGRAVAERLRRRRRHRQGARRVDHDGRDRGRRVRLPRLALRRHLPRRALRRGGGARDVPLLLPPPLSARRRRAGRGRSACPRSTAGCRSRARCSARRTAGSAPTTSSPGGRGAAPAPTSARSAGRRRPTSTALRAEHTAFRERGGIIDMTSFGKTAVEGPGALALLERACCNRIDRPVGAVIYTQMLDARGGILADVTVTRLADDRFRVVSGAGAVDADRGWLELAAAPTTRRVDPRRVGGAQRDRHLGTRRARDPAATTDDDVSSAAFPFRTARELHVGAAPRARPAHHLRGRARLRALRRAAVGGAGLRPAGRGRRPARDRAVRLPLARGPADGEGLPLLRHRPHARRHAGRGRAGVLRRHGDADFTGREALAARRAAPAVRRIRTLLVGGGEYLHRLRRRGGAPRRRRRRPAAQRRLRLHGRAQPRATPTCRSELGPGDGSAVEIFGELVAAEVADDVQYDPGNERVRA